MPNSVFPFQKPSKIAKFSEFVGCILTCYKMEQIRLIIFEIWPVCFARGIPFTCAYLCAVMKAATVIGQVTQLVFWIFTKIPTAYRSVCVCLWYKSQYLDVSFVVCHDTGNVHWLHQVSERTDQEARLIANCPICAKLCPFFDSLYTQAFDSAFISNSVVNTANGTEVAGLVSVCGTQPKDDGAGSGVVWHLSYLGTDLMLLCHHCWFSPGH